MPSIKFLKKPCSPSKCSEDYYIKLSTFTPDIKKVKGGETLTFTRNGNDDGLGFDIIIHCTPTPLNPDRFTNKNKSEFEWSVPDLGGNVNVCKYDVLFPYDGENIKSLDPVIIINPSVNAVSFLIASPLVAAGLGIIFTLLAVRLFGRRRG